jgi:hypothetical protein
MRRNVPAIAVTSFVTVILKPLRMAGRAFGMETPGYRGQPRMTAWWLLAIRVRVWKHRLAGEVDA